MKIKDWLLYYAKSKTNMALSLLCITVIAISIFMLKEPLRLLVPLGCLFIYLLVSGLILFSRRGAKEIAGVKEDGRLKKITETINQYSHLRDKISFLRVADRDVQKAIEYFLLISGTYLDKCREHKTYSPHANHAMEEVLTVCQLYLEELDESSTEKRYNINDKEDFKDYKDKTLAQIQQAAETIKEKTTEDLAGLSREDQFEIMEELRE
jgi:hypothetical protein